MISFAAIRSLREACAAGIQCLQGGRHNKKMYPAFPPAAIEWAHRAITLYGPLLGPVIAAANHVPAAEDADRESPEMSSLERYRIPITSMLEACGMLKDKEAAAMMREAIQRCYTPDNESLSDMAVFTSHFRDYPQDKFALGAFAMVRLVRDFFPSPAAMREIGCAAGMTQENR